jgi:hypothetical protein
MKFGNVNKLFTLIIHYKLLAVPYYETQSYYNLRFVNENVCLEGDSNGGKSLYGSILHSYIWMAYSKNV